MVKVERVRRKLLDIMQPVVHNLFDDWEDWIPQTAVSVNSLVNCLIGMSPLSITYGVEKRLDLLT